MKLFLNPKDICMFLKKLTTRKQWKTIQKVPSIIRVSSWITFQNMTQHVKKGGNFYNLVTIWKRVSSTFMGFELYILRHETKLT